MKNDMLATITEVIAASFIDAQGFLNFMRSDDNNATAWGEVNKIEADEAEYNEAIALIQLSAKEESRWLMENLIKRSVDEIETFRHELVSVSANEVIHDHFDSENNFAWLKSATKDELEAIAEISFDEARDRIKANGTLF